MITNQQTIANNTCTQVYVLDVAWSVIYGLTINAVINEDCRVDAAVMGSWCNGQLVVWAFIVILLLSSL